MDASARRSFHIGRYHCVEALAQSPLGETFRAKVYGVAGLERQYALKQIDASVRADPDLRARLVEAARRYAALEHERIARLTEIHDEGEECWLVTDLARGIDVPRLIAHLKGRGERLPVEQAILIAIDVAEALLAGVTNGVLHEGLWPSVVMVLGEGEVRLADFAVSGALERPGWATDDALVSVLGYTAPERLRGASASAQSDLWALGALAYELCAGEPLYAATSVASLGALRSRGPGWDKLPARPGLRDVLERLLADDPAQRPKSAHEAREMLTGLLGLELGRTRQGLQGLVKRALGRALTRTGSFAAVAIPSTSMPTLVADVPAAATTPSMPVASGPRTLLGIPTHQTAAALPKPEHRAWSPPRKTGAMPIVLPDQEETRRGPATLQGLGEPAPHVDAMEVALLPPDVQEQTFDHTLEQPKLPMTEKSMDAMLAFDEEVETSPRRRVEEPQLVGDGTAELEVTAAYDEAPAEPVRTVTNKLPSTSEPALPPPPPSDAPPAVLPSLRVSSPMPATPDGAPGPLHAEPAERFDVELTADISPIPPGAKLSPSPVDASDLTPLPPPHPLSLSTSPVSTLSEPDPSVPAAVRPDPSEKLSAVIAPFVPEPPPSGRGVMLGACVATLGVAAAVWLAVHKADQPVPPAVVPPAIAKVETPKVEAPKVEAPIAKVEEPKPVQVESPEPVAKVEEPKPMPVETSPAVAGQISIASTPAGASVWIDGEQKGQTPLTTSALAGAHRLAILGPGQKLFTQQVTIGAEGLSLSQPLEVAHLGTAAEGGLKVRCHTSGEMRILVDGNDTGLTCPNDVRIPVAPGTHKIGLYSPRTGETHEVDGEINEDADHSTRIYVRY